MEFISPPVHHILFIFDRALWNFVGWVTRLLLHLVFNAVAQIGDNSFDPHLLIRIFNVQVFVIFCACQIRGITKLRALIS